MLARRWLSVAWYRSRWGLSTGDEEAHSAYKALADRGSAGRCSLRPRVQPRLLHVEKIPGFRNLVDSGSLKAEVLTLALTRMCTCPCARVWVRVSFAAAARDDDAVEILGLCARGLQRRF